MTPVTIVCGPPGGGKSTYVRENMEPGDLVLDVDELFKALSLLDMRQKPEGLLPFVLEARDAVIRLLGKGFLGPRRAWIITSSESSDTRRELAERLRAKVVVLPVPTGECLERMRKQGRPDWHVREMAEVCERWNKFFKLEAGEKIPDRPAAYGVDGFPV